MIHNSTMRPVSLGGETGRKFLEVVFNTLLFHIFEHFVDNFDLIPELVDLIAQGVFGELL